MVCRPNHNRRIDQTRSLQLLQNGTDFSVHIGDIVVVPRHVRAHRFCVGIVWRHHNVLGVDSLGYQLVLAIPAHQLHHKMHGALGPIAQGWKYATFMGDRKIDKAKKGLPLCPLAPVGCRAAFKVPNSGWPAIRKGRTELIIQFVIGVGVITCRA